MLTISSPDAGPFPSNIAAQEYQAWATASLGTLTSQQVLVERGLLTRDESGTFARTPLGAQVFPALGNLTLQTFAKVDHQNEFDKYISAADLLTRHGAGQFCTSSTALHVALKAYCPHVLTKHQKLGGKGPAQWTYAITANNCVDTEDDAPATDGARARNSAAFKLQRPADDLSLLQVLEQRSVGADMGDSNVPAGIVFPAKQAKQTGGGQQEASAGSRKRPGVPLEAAVRQPIAGGRL
jgi:hypothetical protein